MVINKSITISEEAYRVITAMQKDNLEFKFSSFINDLILSSRKDNTSDTLKDIDSQIALNNNQIKVLISKINILFDKKAELEVLEEMKEVQKQKEKEKEIEKKIYAEKNMKWFFNDTCGREMTDEELKEFYEMVEDKRADDIWDYIQKKGFNVK